MRSLRELLASAIVSGDPYPLLEALVEAVEPEDTDATIRKLREERDQATGERENLLEACRWWKQRYNNELHLRQEAEHLLFVEQEVRVSDAEIGRLVRGMRRGSTLRHTTDCADRPDWVAHWSGAGGMIITNSGSDDPAEALRAIQEVGDDKS